MFVLRVFFRTGATLDFNYSDIGVAQRAIDAITEKRAEMGQVRILDEAGRDYRFAAEEILCEGLTDVEAETASVVHLGVTINRAGQLAKTRLGIEEPMPQQPQPRPQDQGYSFAPPPPAPAGALDSLIPTDRRVPRFSR